MRRGVKISQDHKLRVVQRAETVQVHELALVDLFNHFIYGDAKPQPERTTATNNSMEYQVVKAKRAEV